MMEKFQSSNFRNINFSMQILIIFRNTITLIMTVHPIHFTIVSHPNCCKPILAVVLIMEEYAKQSPFQELASPLAILNQHITAHWRLFGKFSRWITAASKELAQSQNTSYFGRPTIVPRPGQHMHWNTAFVSHEHLRQADCQK